jgi:hypothetical protein
LLTDGADAVDPTIVRRPASGEQCRISLEAACGIIV